MDIAFICQSRTINGGPTVPINGDRRLASIRGQGITDYNSLPEFSQVSGPHPLVRKLCSISPFIFNVFYNSPIRPDVYTHVGPEVPG